VPDQADNQPPQGPIQPNVNQAVSGLNLDSTARELKPGTISYALNAVTTGWDGRSLTYQNEQGNLLCCTLPKGYRVIGQHNILEDNTLILFLCNPTTNGSEIGKVQDCVYSTLINASCLDFSLLRPIQQAVHKKTSCSTEVYWTDGGKRRFLDLSKLPYKQIPGTDNCTTLTTTEIDCNLLSVQPNFSIPSIEITRVSDDGQLKAGTVQFAVQYANGLGDGYTSYYSITNPLPLFQEQLITPDFNYEVGKSVHLNISGLDTTGYYDYFNLAVIKTINNIASVELVGTYFIDRSEKTLIYSGQAATAQRLSMDDIFQKFPVYDSAEGLYTTGDVLGWYGLSSQEQVSYQKIANQISLQWQTHQLPLGAYHDPLTAATRRGYMRDEVYPFELVPLLKNGHQSEGFHIPARKPTAYDLEAIHNEDVVQEDTALCSEENKQASPRWQVYNTATLLGQDPTITPCGDGAYQWGQFAYWQSTETYPCRPDIWGELAGTPIRHHKFPDCLVAPHHGKGVIYPLGVRVDVQQILDLIRESDLTEEQKANIQGFKIVRGNRAGSKSIIAKGLLHNVGKYSQDGTDYYYPNYPYNDVREDSFLGATQSKNDDPHTVNKRLRGFESTESKQRFTFHSPDTHFYQPTLGHALKVEGIEQGSSRGHFVPVKNHARYAVPSTGAYISAVVAGATVGVLSNTFGLSDTVINGQAAALTIQLLIDVIEKTIPQVNYAYQFNSVGNYTELKPVKNEGNKQRTLQLASYLSPGMVSAGDQHTINNHQRESSVYLKTTATLPFTHELGAVQDQSRYRLGDWGNCDSPWQVHETPISAFYGSIKQNLPDQYGQIYSYETLDTGFQWTGDIYSQGNGVQTLFGGDTYINSFSYKTKLPFFLDHRINFPDGADVMYNEIPNLAYPLYWFSTDAVRDSSILNFIPIIGLVRKFFGVKANNFDCASNSRFFYQWGKFYLFAYGLPSFPVESQVNVDMRQAYNALEGDFYPRVSSDIPDEWLQYIQVPIQQDNTYYYNKTLSKQNKENYFAHLPENFSALECKKHFPFRTIWSEKQSSTQDYKKNNWLIYRPASFFDFPNNSGRLVSIDEGEKSQLLVRTENKSYLYNALMTAPTSAGQVYLGQPLFSSEVPPIDFNTTDSGYAGTQHKLFLRTENGNVSVDAKRGQVFLYPQVVNHYTRPQAVDITKGGMSQFFTNYLNFQIQKYFPGVDVDNCFAGIGLSGTYDDRYNRILLTKLDYEPRVKGLTYREGRFFKADQEVFLSDPAYFTNRSFTLSFCFDTQSWVSFHSWLPGFYVPETNIFYTGLNKGESSSLWVHNQSRSLYNNFYGDIHPYVLEYPYYFEGPDQIVQNIKDSSQVLQCSEDGSYVETNDLYFNKLILHSSQQCSGILNLVQKPRHSLKQMVQFPRYNQDSKDVLVAKSASTYQINTFWDCVRDYKKPIWTPSRENTSVYRDLNQDNMSYDKRSHKKAPIRASNLKVRFILDNRSDIRILSQILQVPSVTSYK
jgi:hypothetical protein